MKSNIKELTSRITLGIYDGGYVDLYYRNNKPESVCFRSNDKELYFDNFQAIKEWHKELGEVIKYLEDRNNI